MVFLLRARHGGNPSMPAFCSGLDVKPWRIRYRSWLILACLAAVTIAVISGWSLSGQQLSEVSGPPVRHHQTIGAQARQGAFGPRDWLPPAPSVLEQAHVTLVSGQHGRAAPT